MIPLRLSLHNFMCYRDPEPLDFSGLHLACLSGDNGHGKSALLDAMTWALWGQARVSQADELITLGETEMWVELEFALGDQRYRVYRARERRGKGGKSVLELQVQEPNGTWRVLTEPTIRETEQRIVALLRMDYDTFINSAYLRQGRADEFTLRSPAERKEILMEILGLSRYDLYEKRAKERARSHKEEADRLEAQIAAIDEELAREAQYASELQIAQAQVIECSDRRRMAEDAQRERSAEHQHLRAQQQRLQDVERQTARLQQELARIEESLRRTLERLAEGEALLADAAAIEAGYAALRAAREAEQAHSARLARQIALERARAQTAEKVHQERQRLEVEVGAAAERLANLQARAEQEPTLQEQLTQAQAALAQLQAEDARLQDLTAQVQALREESAKLNAHNEALHKEGDELSKRIARLEGLGAVCPTCNRSLDVSERDRIVSEFREQLEQRRAQYRTNKARLQEMDQQVKALEKERSALDADLRRRRADAQREVARLEAQLAEARRAAGEIAAVEEGLSRVRARLAAGDYAAAERAALAQIEAEMAAVGYDERAHATAREALRTYEPFEERHRRLQSARERHADLQAQAEDWRAQRRRRQEELDAQRAQADGLRRELDRLPQVEQELRTLSAELMKLVAEEQRARERLGAAQQRLDACQEQRRRREVLARRRDQLRQQQALYEELQAAFSKRGLPAMIIETAIPEIEAEANRLLHRMTDGRMALRLETQRETRTTGEPRETLEIVLSDELGSRDYHLFSGGEAFRANIALRIALSKLLARRAGAALQTLIIDEGFGTQDAQGRERLVQAITSIQDDFQRVLVITHLEELKDQFPARIEVVKTEAGSQIRVV
ncbi:MAG: SMC family ATPase [Caldilineales bacterium]|nr:SMC family ATPase [Caldilineales bacterium]MDW8316780.1 SMC family ATPase [Anaerolineae bacterium]